MIRPLSAAALLLAGASVSAQVRIDTPVGGWRRGEGEGAAYTQPVNYPASSVNTPEGQSDAARIRGRIVAAEPKNPALLVVNGTAMPLKLDDAGNFDRPYLFNGGSNSVEVRSAEGASHRVQFHAAAAGEVPARLRVLLAWDSDHTDLDLHVITPDGAHAWYGGRVLPNGGALDVDVTTGFGPEIFSTPTPLPGRYLVYVNYYGGSGSGDLTVASVTVIGAEGTADEKRSTLQVPMRNAGELTLAASFSYP